MAEPTLADLQESIDQLAAYQERLHKDVVSMGQKLRLSQKKIDAAVAEHTELQRISKILDQLKAQRDLYQGQGS
ncbi:hypothetical protein OMCYN_00368 [cyanobiont of Ornithocercus magnificus]|nr:hypothetical protein OMCYN_00368 [cyanobiont of Ornithocercus magnificus]